MTAWLVAGAVALRCPASDSSGVVFDISPYRNEKHMLKYEFFYGKLADTVR
ncbi:hypothetical protein [Hydrogenophaga sp.]|uniref:hypothetical protein n=1 Tax=Hydrogenophaga sp. TaxID=1904254 RepID=UPI003564BA72